ncbi:HNH endonuclease signature motif containing protein [Actinophytocola sp. NPDC049390]|uniref:HNH endonuclease signature motif containing protein n=1 Tax=Actinophytocola sp. NPDC049390 TaxID=3363894 RepID=UPI0037A4A72A
MKTPAEVRHGQTVTPGPNACWLWTGGLDPAGYARFRDDTGRKVYVHRWAYEHYVGPVPEGLVLDHLCRIRHCSNPAHLEAVTQDENMRRGAHATKTHCKHGHPMSEVLQYKDGPRRVCRTCKRASARASYLARKNRPEAMAGGYGCPGTKMRSAA